MQKYIVNGGKAICGEMVIPGAKNSVLPILAATVISGRKTFLYNCPQITDVDNTLKILEGLGCSVKKEGSNIEVDSSFLNSSVVEEDMTDKMRSSIVLAGAVLARMKTVKMGYPGGCELGLRPIDIHIKAFRDMGVAVNEEEGVISLDGRNMKGGDIHLSFPSVGATENIMLAAMGIKDKVRIINAAKEPEIEDLADMLNKMGGRISGAGTGIIEIEGIVKAYDIRHGIIPDRIVAATYMTAAAVTRGKIEIVGANPSHLDAVISVLKETGTEIAIKENGRILVCGPKRIRCVDLLRTSPYPGFPTDAQSLMITLFAMSEGCGMVVEKVFDCRFRHAEELMKMGADIKTDGCCAFIKGVHKLHGARVCAPDLRSGAALTVAALAAEGKSEISNICYIERGYENLAGAFAEAGADISLL